MIARQHSKSAVLFFIITFLIIAPEKELRMAHAELLQLPTPNNQGDMSLEEAIATRRSHRHFKSVELTKQQMAQLLWAAQGITAVQEGLHYRTAPSAGALYPLEIYILTKDGIFHYRNKEHSLAVVSEQDARVELSQAALGQEAILEAPLSFVICAVYERVMIKYGKRGIRYTHMEAGHVAQNIHLQSVSLGLSSVPMGAFADDQVKKLLSLPAEQQPLYIVPVGYAR